MEYFNKHFLLNKIRRKIGKILKLADVERG